MNEILYVCISIDNKHFMVFLLITIYFEHL